MQGTLGNRSCALRKESGLGKQHLTMLTVILLFKDRFFFFKGPLYNSILHLVFNQEKPFAPLLEESRLCCSVFYGLLKRPSGIILVPGTDLESGSSGSQNCTAFPSRPVFLSLRVDLVSLTIKPMWGPSSGTV